MTNYTELAPEVHAAVSAEEITLEVARNSHNLGLVFAGFIAMAAQMPAYRDLAANNSKERFVEFLTEAPMFRRDFGSYLVGLAS
jgi:hypothetical protein